MTKARFHDDLPHLQTRAALGPGLREVVNGCVGHAMQANARTPDAEVVHEARRALKRARAVLELGEMLGVAGAKPARRRLAAIGRELSPRRDESVVTGLARRWAGKPADLTGGVMAAESALEPGRDEATWWAAWQRRLGIEGRRLGRIAWGRIGEEAVRRALRQGAKRVGRRAKAAGAKSGVAKMHEWRKAVIGLREQLHVMRPLLDAKEAAVSGELHALAQRLGRAMDCHVLREALRRRGKAGKLCRADVALAKAAKQHQGRAVEQAEELWPQVRRTLRRRF